MRSELLTSETNSKINHFTYVGDQLYGEYMLKFLPQVRNGWINVHRPERTYAGLAIENFQRKRHIEMCKRMIAPVNYTQAPFPHLKIKFPHHVSFFLQGYQVAKIVLGSTALLVTCAGSYWLWAYVGRPPLFRLALSGLFGV